MGATQTLHSSSAPHAVAAKEEEYLRFNTSQRIEHALQVISFTMLVLTGLPQKFAMAGWGWTEPLVWFFGGIDNTRFIHRLFAAMFVMEAIYHVGYLTYAVFLKRARWTMMLTLKDAADVIVQIKYYLGITPHEPRYDRYDYRQKFEYMGVVWGGMVMIATGFILAFPAWFTRFIPGEMVAAAKEAHGGEALLAFLVIVTWHLYGTHLNPKRFPADMTIFTGKISRERMLEEHPLELERIEQERKQPATARRDGPILS